MSIRVSVWDKILKVIIAVASAIEGVIGGQVMAVKKRRTSYWEGAGVYV